MNPIHTTTEDCKRCQGIGYEKITCGDCEHESCDTCNNEGWVHTNCQSCNKGKTTKLIYDAKEIECNYCHAKKEDLCINKIVDDKLFYEWKCDGTGYILRKKGETIRVDSCECKGDFHSKKCNNPFRIFHLTSDAEVKSVKQYVFDEEITGKEFSKFYKILNQHNLKEDSKIVICEGYYE